MEITQEMFEAYVEVQESGLTNMYDVNAVIELAEDIAEVTLTRDQIKDIMKNYGALSEKYTTEQ